MSTKKTFTLSENKLKNIISESIKTVLNESTFDEREALKSISSGLMGEPYDKKYEQFVKAAKNIQSSINKAEFMYGLSPNAMFIILTALSTYNS